MKPKTTYLILLLWLGISNASLGQEITVPEREDNIRSYIRYSVQYYPNLRLNFDDLGVAQVHMISLGGFKPEEFPIELGPQLALGYSSDVILSFGGHVAYVQPLFEQAWIKAGLSLDRIFTQPNNYVEVGEYENDDIHDSAMPYLELDVNIHPRVALSLSANYRFIRSDVYKVVDRTVHTRPDGSEYEITRSKHRELYYRSGWNIGAGIQLNF
jgi:hypothetical protein